eukprot:40559-Eustigmatos_ZCMA.PRE.1
MYYRVATPSSFHAGILQDLPMVRGSHALRMALACVVLLSHAAEAWHLPRAFNPLIHRLHGRT